MKSRIFSEVMSASFWALLNAVSSRLLNMITMILAARALTKEQYGSLALMMNSAQTLSLLVGAGFSVTLARFVASYSAHEKARTPGLVVTLLLVSFLIGILISLVLVVFSDLISQQYFSGSLKPNDVSLVGGWTFLLTMVTVVQGTLSGFEAFRQNAVIAFFCGMAVLVLVLVGPASDPFWVLSCLLVGNILTLLFSGRLLFRRIDVLREPGKKLIDSEYVGLIFRFGLPALVSGVIVTQSQWYANVQVAASENGLTSMAGLSVALQWYAIVQFVPGVIANSLLPLLSRTSSDVAHSKSIFTLGLTVNVLAAVLTAASVLIGADLILRLYGSDYIEALHPFRILVMAACVAGSASLVLQKIASQGRSFVLLTINIVWCGAFFIAIIGLAGDSPSATSVAVAYLLANIFQALSGVICLFVNKGVRSAA